MTVNKSLQAVLRPVPWIQWREITLHTLTGTAEHYYFIELQDLLYDFCEYSSINYYSYENIHVDLVSISMNLLNFSYKNILRIKLSAQASY